MRVRIPLNRDWEFTERFDGAFLRGERPGEIAALDLNAQPSLKLLMRGER